VQFYVHLIKKSMMFYYTCLLIFKDGFSGAWVWLSHLSLGQRKSCQGLHVVQAWWHWMVWKICVCLVTIFVIA